MTSLYKLAYAIDQHFGTLKPGQLTPEEQQLRADAQMAMGKDRIGYYNGAAKLFFVGPTNEQEQAEAIRRLEDAVKNGDVEGVIAERSKSGLSDSRYNSMLRQAGGEEPVSLSQSQSSQSAPAFKTQNDNVELWVFLHLTGINDGLKLVLLHFTLVLPILLERIRVVVILVLEDDLIALLLPSVALFNSLPLELDGLIPFHNNL